MKYLLILLFCLAGCIESPRDRWTAGKTADAKPRQARQAKSAPARNDTLRKAAPPPRSAPNPRVAAQAPAPTVSPKTDLDRNCPLNVDPRRFTRPEQVRAMLECASRRSGVPADVLFGIWIIESGGKLYGEVGKCSAVEQFRIRVAHGRSDQMPALRRMAAAYGWDVSSIRGSCGRSTMTENHRNFGGCLGPMQITPSEWLQEPDWERYDPMNAYHALIVTGWRLKRHRDQFRARNPGKDDQLAWRNAVERYIGGAGSHDAFRYYATVVNGRGFQDGGWASLSRMGWWHWTEMRRSGDFTPLYAAASRKYPHID